MNIYKLINPKFNRHSFDTYSQAVVVAEDEAQARLIHPSGSRVVQLVDWVIDWCLPEEVVVELVDTFKVGVVLSNFLAA